MSKIAKKKKKKGNEYFVKKKKKKSKSLHKNAVSFLVLDKCMYHVFFFTSSTLYFYHVNKFVNSKVGHLSCQLK